jgi:hypothetical protein
MSARLELDVLLRRVDATAEALSEVSRQLMLVVAQLNAPASPADDEEEAREKP